MMKKLVMAVSLLLTAGAVMAQEAELRRDIRSKMVMEDSNNIYNAENISKLDLLQALELLDVRINKVKLPRTDKPRSFGIIVDEYAGLKLIKSDTTWLGENTYVYWEEGDTLMYKDYLEDLTILTKENKQDSNVMVQIKTYSMRFGFPVKYKKESEKSFYNIRSFRPVDMKYGEKVPVLAIASSWYDEKYNINRFCGASVLSFGDWGTEELLKMSPNYYIISYLME